MPAFNEITPQQLLRLIGLPDSPAIIDLRTDEDFNDDPRLVPGAVRWSFRDVPGLTAYLGARSRAAVLYCQKGRKIAHGTATQLRASGISAEILQGGQFGWRDAQMPMVRSPEAVLDTAGPSRWVTRHRPKIDRIACPWLIRRFIDPHAEFLFVPPGDVMDVAEKFDAVPFDVEGVTFSHRAERCTFDTLLEDFGLTSGPLERLATVVRAADTNRHDLAPQAAGLLALSVGLSRQYRDDHEQLAAGMPLYDALYRWARDGADEGHDWPGDRGAAGATV